MARTNNLNNFLTDVATAIRNKKGTTNPIQASTFDTEISSIETGISIDEYFDLTPQIVNSKMTSCIKEIPLIDTSSYTDMSNMFKDFGSITSIPTLNTTNVTDMNNMFTNCSKLTTIPVLNTGNVTNMNHMFDGCYMFNEMPLINTAKVTDMSFMFKNTNITTIVHIDTSATTTMADMFTGCSNLVSIPQLDTSSVENVNYMFEGCVNLTTVPQLNGSKLTQLSNVFSGCEKLADFGGFYNLGESYDVNASENKWDYNLDLENCAALTHDSLMNIINGLYDIKTKGVAAQALTLGTTNSEKLTTEEKNIAVEKGWNVI